MEIIKKYLLDHGFSIVGTDCENGVNLEFRYSKFIEGFAVYNVFIFSHTNWFFSMEIEKISQSSFVVGFTRHTCFKGTISSESPIEVLEIILNSTHIKAILEM